MLLKLKTEIEENQLALVSFGNENAALLLVTYLISQDIPASYAYVEGDLNHQVLLDAPDLIQEAAFIVKEFVDNPTDPKYQQKAWELRQEIIHDRQQAILPKIRWTSFQQTPFMWLIMGICLLVYISSLAGGSYWVNEHLMLLPWNLLFESGQWWRAITPAFIHFDEMHIIFNLLWWWFAGKEIEKKFGSSTLLLIFLLCAIIPNLGQLMTDGPEFGGLSGVVYGVIGFVWWCGWLRPQWGLALPNYIIGFSLVWLVLGYVDILWVSVANTAHTLGLVCGCAIAWCYVHFTQNRSQKDAL
ncbi:rhomboid family intramembrane serine protease GlpG [Aliiglaciecola lipolytica]|uniref:GlpG protein n=1 Tax=Aliiglaciecola lipolytica E3 TaxID=1127673 RepID=K6YBA9_9ALTE|nr:rhomboid family intramembrane serine protease GlpG [Aliiglaciecola lipolytica]GAC15472.1 GlpG protein [Aliiglaciecola lipolytica E3]